MEAMDYNYFASAQQPYQYMGYGDAGLLSSTGEVIGATPVGYQNMQKAQNSLTPIRAEYGGSRYRFILTQQLRLQL